MSIIPRADAIEPDLEYPESDGLPMAENTTQFLWIVKIKEGIQAMFRGRHDVFVAGDLFWYPVEGQNELRVAPDTLVVFGRPPGPRGSYMQWEEDGIPPQVVFEVLSPGNTAAEMRHKRDFYDRFGVEEYYIYDPFQNALEGWLRGDEDLQRIEAMNGWISPRLGLRFQQDSDTLRLIRPDGRALETYEEVDERAEQAVRRAERLAAQLRALGIEPDELGPDNP